MSAMIRNSPAITTPTIATTISISINEKPICFPEQSALRLRQVFQERSPLIICIMDQYPPTYTCIFTGKAKLYCVGNPYFGRAPTVTKNVPLKYSVDVSPRDIC